MFPEANKCFFFPKHVAQNPHHRCRIRKSDLDDSHRRMYDRIDNAEELLIQAWTGTQAERLAVQYAFEELGMTAIHADAVLKNIRSQHVLEKVGFCLVGEDEVSKTYRMER